MCVPILWTHNWARRSTTPCKDLFGPFMSVDIWRSILTCDEVEGRLEPSVVLRFGQSSADERQFHVEVGTHQRRRAASAAEHFQFL